MTASGPSPRTLFYLLLTILGLYHFQLLGKGALAFPDERVSIYGLKAIDALLEGRVGEAAGAVSGWGARPAENLIRMPAEAVQRAIEYRTGRPSLSARSLVIPTLQNVVVAFLVPLVFFFLVRRWLGEVPGLLAATVFALLSVNHFWVRHIVPYDMAILVHLLAVWAAIDARPGAAGPGFWKLVPAIAFPGAVLLVAYPIVFFKYRGLGLWIALGLWAVCGAGRFLLRSRFEGAAFHDLFRCGLVSGLGLAFYPAYYSFVPVVGALVVCSGAADRLVGITRAGIERALVFTLGTASVVFGFEFLSRLGGVSYLGGARLLARTLDQGDYSEGYVYLFKWLADTDPWIAWWLMPLGILGSAKLIGDGVRGRLNAAQISMARAVTFLWLLYLVYGTQSTILHRMNFSGRYARMYIPALVIPAAYLVSCIPTPSIRRAAMAAAVVLSAVNMTDFAFRYSQAAFPVDEVITSGIRFEDVTPERRIFESEIVPDYNLPVEPLTSGNAMRTVPGDERFTLVNFGWFDLRGHSYAPYKPREGERLITDRPHFQCFVNSLYEGFGMKRRQDCRDHDFRLRIYALEPADPPGSVSR